MKTAQQRAEAAGFVRHDGPFGTFTIDAPTGESFGIFIPGDEARGWDEAAYSADYPRLA